MPHHPATPAGNACTRLYPLGPGQRAICVFVIEKDDTGKCAGSQRVENVDPQR
jgi:hypothetical protein